MEFLYCIYNEFLLKLLPANLANFATMLTFPVIPFCITAGCLIVVVLFLVLFERKFLALLTQRFGPNRVGYCGCLQTVADAIKLLFKESISPDKHDLLLFNIAPILAFVPVMVCFGIVPFCNEYAFMDFSVNLLLFTAVATVPILGILAAGYSSNNKYSLVGSLRAVIQAISYELPLIFSLLGIVFLSSSLNLTQIIETQCSAAGIAGWNILPAFLGFFIVYVCALAELNRCPFDLSEAESELVAGYNTEYSGMKFAFFFLAEYAMMFVLSAFITVLFLGGYLSPFGTYFSNFIGNSLISNILVYFEQIIWLFLKTFLIFSSMMLVRATLPRFKASDLLKFSWGFLLPLSFLNLLIIIIFKWSTL